MSQYEGRWDLLHVDVPDGPIVLPPEFRDYALEKRVGLPEEHPWRDELPQC